MYSAFNNSTRTHTHTHIYIYIYEKHNLIKIYKLHNHNIFLYKRRKFYLNDFFIYI